MWRIVIVCSICAGCSFAFVSGPPPNHRQLPMFDCSESRIAPIIDTAWTALMTLDFVGASITTDQKWHDIYCSPSDTACTPPISRTGALPLYAAFAAVFGAGAYYGYTRTAECRAAKTELMQRSSAIPRGTWPPPPSAAPLSPPGAPPAPPAAPPQASAPTPAEPAPPPAQ